MSNSINFDGVKIYVDIVKLINGLDRVARRTLSGTILKDNKNEMNDLLNKLEDHINRLSSIFPKYDSEDGDIHLTLPSFYNFSLEEMLKDHPELRNNLISEPTYFEDIDYIYQPIELNNISSITNETIRNYIQCVSLFLLIKTQSDHTNITATNEEKLYFLGNKKLIITNDLKPLNTIKTNSINNFKKSYIESHIHKESIKQIIKDSFVNYYSPISEVSFNKICEDFDDIYNVIKNNYETYISEFTFSKIKREVDKFRTETIVRINKTFSDIQMQIITIPASLIIVTANFKVGKDFSLRTNSVILLGALFFAVAVYYICENQKDTLKNIKNEINSHKNELQKDPLFSQNTEINEDYSLLKDRYKKQRDNLHKIKISVIFSAILATSIYFVILLEHMCLIYNIAILNDFYCK